tara:strand:+ start:8406 stop:8627 length:222 start_codon:yes stop_codon:yes gene_type:complete
MRVKLARKYQNVMANKAESALALMFQIHPGIDFYLMNAVDPALIYPENHDILFHRLSSGRYPVVGNLEPFWLF